MKWKDYEIYITRHFQKLFPDATIQHNVRCLGLISKTPRQIDMLIEQKISGFDIKIIVDCKYFNKKVDVKDVESFLSFLQDLKASKGVLITNKGYSSAAQNRADYDTQDIDLRIIDFGDLDEFQTLWAIPYQNSHCAVVSSPPGWIIDSRTIPGKWLASLYPAGLTIKEGFHTEGFIYINFFDKGLNISTEIDKRLDILTLDDLLTHQNKNLDQQYTNLKIEYISTIKREDCICKLRIVDCNQMKDCNSLEYTLFMDYEDVVIILVLLTPSSKSKEYVKKLEWLALKLIKGEMLQNDSGK